MQKNSEKLVNFIKDKLEEEFNKEMIAYGLTKMQIHENNLNNIRSG